MKKETVLGAVLAAALCFGSMVAYHELRVTYLESRLRRERQALDKKLHFILEIQSKAAEEQRRIDQLRDSLSILQGQPQDAERVE